MNEKDIANGSFSASSSVSVVVTKNNTLDSAASSTTSVAGVFKVNLNNYRGIFVFSFSESVAVVSQNNLIIKDCNTYKLPYTRKNDEIKFSRFETLTNNNC